MFGFVKESRKFKKKKRQRNKLQSEILTLNSRVRKTKTLITCVSGTCCTADRSRRGRRS